MGGLILPLFHGLPADGPSAMFKTIKTIFRCKMFHVKQDTAAVIGDKYKRQNTAKPPATYSNKWFCGKSAWEIYQLPENSGNLSCLLSLLGFRGTVCAFFRDFNCVYQIFSLVCHIAF